MEVNISGEFYWDSHVFFKGLTVGGYQEYIVLPCPTLNDPQVMINGT